MPANLSGDISPLNATTAMTDVDKLAPAADSAMNNSTIATPTPTVQPQMDGRAQSGGPPSGMTPPAGMQPPSGMQRPSGAPSGTPPTGGIGSATPTPTPAAQTSSLGGIKQTAGSGTQTGSLPSSSQSMSAMGNSLYNYVSSMRPTIPSLFKS